MISLRFPQEVLYQLVSGLKPQQELLPLSKEAEDERGGTALEQALESFTSRAVSDTEPVAARFHWVPGEELRRVTRDCGLPWKVREWVIVVVVLAGKTICLPVVETVRL